MRSRTTAVISALASLLLALGIALPAVTHAADAKLGKVNFPTSCNPAAQKEFEVAMAYYHSFAWPELKATLERVIQADPACGMAHWGARWGCSTTRSSGRGASRRRSSPTGRPRSTRRAPPA